MAPVIEKVCFSPGDPERNVDFEILSPRKGQVLNPGSNLFISWTINEVNGACGEVYATVEATYHNHPFATIFQQDVIADPAIGNQHYTVRDLSTLEGYGRQTCDLVCFWVTVNDELGPIGEPKVVAVGPLTVRPTPHRIPQDRTEF